MLNFLMNASGSIDYVDRNFDGYPAIPGSTCVTTSLKLRR